MNEHVLRTLHVSFLVILVVGVTPFAVLKRLLLLSQVPLQCLAQAVDPILVALADGHDGREGEARGADGDVVARVELDSVRAQVSLCRCVGWKCGFLPFSAIEADPAACASIVRHAQAQDYGVWEDDGAEGQGMCAYGRDEDDGVVWMAE